MFMSVCHISNHIRGSKARYQEQLTEVPIKTNASTVRPDDARILKPAVCLKIVLIVVVDAILSGHELVDETIAVALKA